MFPFQSYMLNHIALVGGVSRGPCARGISFGEGPFGNVV